jgi:type VI secretion system protein ImpL
MKYVSDNLFLIALLIATLLTLVLLAIVFSAALSGGSAKAVKTLRLLGAESLRLSFRSAVKLIEANLVTRAERYNLSWTLLLNESTRGELPLPESGLHSALSTDSSLSAAAQGIVWNFFDKGVVVQLRSNYLGTSDLDSVAGEATSDAASSGKSSGVWDDFLGLCRSYRPQRPFDCIVLAIPCAALLQSDPQGQLALMARAKAIHRRLWLAQNRLALRFPIHLVVTECEDVPGFASFGAALPEPMRRSMLGWASPYELVAPFRIQWVDSAVDQMVGAVADSCAELCALEAADAGSGAYFLLPGELERLRAGLKIFCEELMRPSAYHESFLLRGMYLTGDCSAAAVLRASAAGQAAGPPAELSAIATPAQGETGLAPRESMPAFLRDIFERKIFAEVGLVRSSSQRMRRPAAGRLAYWSALIAPALWALGLGLATFQLHGMQAAVLAYLQMHGANAPGPDPTLPQTGAIATLASFEPLGGARFGSVFMPGSWPLFDDLQERLRDRLEKGFATDVVAALRDAAFSRVSGLTGAVRDPATGRLPENGQCTLPAHWSEQPAAPSTGLNLGDLPEYSAVLNYVNRLDELDRAIAAMQRLASPGEPPHSADLVLAVQILLNKDLQIKPTRGAVFFRAAAQGGLLLPLGPIRSAARCALRLADEAMYQRLFDRNSLLLGEQKVAESVARLHDSAGQDADLGARLLLWQTLRMALDEQQGRLVAGQGGWMRQSVLDLGSAQVRLLKRIADNRLLGAPAVQDSKALAARGFGRFAMAWESAVTSRNPVDGSGALVWAGTGWDSTPERKALRVAVTAMMAQPYMNAGAPPHLPEVPAGATIRWDRAQLEHVASLSEARKSFRRPGRAGHGLAATGGHGGRPGDGCQCPRHAGAGVERCTAADAGASHRCRARHRTSHPCMAAGHGRARARRRARRRARARRPVAAGPAR